ncbi:MULTISPECIES: DNA polymerase III subunit epsilon [unclassified Epibacterium]|uniref:DNA polymerase III subunit epsilon n=1 Tax=unclassified Epibacterium TaxID=2639179 RepID=UPI001EF5FAB3|nr:MULTISPECIES: DNA polymerase III subunit epsilon [unclassified Epibacterium]MCG7623749.1 DNA polymerase III subunit epsilon [Epibacterium sp. Ofav1-8]MCG7628280.1 DNA polymerase III subunit epsilon [Epibacterium sp. MM17-32]
MREIVLDTETTGFDPFSGDRIVEIGAVELLNHMPTGETFHVYINPQRSMPQEAFGVHGIGPDLLEPPQPPGPGQVTLKDKPLFAEVGQAFLDFVRDSKMVIHNASFDMKFLNAELGWMNLPQLPMDQAIDTLAMARKRFPGSPATLDALCRRFSIDNSNRTLHGALLDSEILADVYLELIGGRQPDFGLSSQSDSGPSAGDLDWRPQPRATALPSRLTADEKAEHEKFVAKLGEDALWNAAPDT